jgi:GTP-binding protein HflX
LTDASVYAADQLFATLDPTLKKLQLSEQQDVILADTVGFIRHLPHDLVAAFRATLVETREADLILQVVDCADENRQEKIVAVDRVLQEVGAGDIPQLLIYNKIDLPEFKPRIDVDEQGQAWRVWLSAKDRTGFDDLMKVLQDRFCDDTAVYQLILQAKEGQIRAYLFDQDVILSEEFDNNGDIHLKLRLSSTLLKRIYSKFQISPDRFEFQADSLAGAA